MAEQTLETYHGNCHCGAFKFSVKLPELKVAYACNCSICLKKGYLWASPVSNDRFSVEKGDGVLKEYLFGNKTLTHKFCPTCGTAVMAQKHVEGPSIGVNIRTLQAFDEATLEIKPFDGASIGAPHAPPNGSDVTDLEDGSNTKRYRGSCHCGAVTFDLDTPPLEDLEPWSCNCSICARNATLWLYPPTTSVHLHNAQNLTSYQFGSKTARHVFCSTCGVPIANIFDEDPPVASLKGKLPVNVRAVNGVDVTALKVKKVDGKSWGQKYEV